MGRSKDVSTLGVYNRITEFIKKLMKTNIIILLVLLLISCQNGIISKDETVTDANKILYQKGKSNPYTGLVRTYRDIDKTKIATETSYQDGKQNGLYLEYRDNGVLQLQEYYKNGLRDSLYLKYWSNGALKRKGFYRNDTPIGIWIEYDRQGIIIDEHDYSKHVNEKAVIEVTE